MYVDKIKLIKAKFQFLCKDSSVCSQSTTEAKHLFEMHKY